MRAWVIRATGSLDRIELTDVPPPTATLGPGDVRVGIRAAALNHLDLHVVQGLPLEYRFPHILGADGAGVVEAVGRDVAALRPGDRVMLNPGIADYSCEYCRAGEHSLCLNYRLLGEHVPGTLTESVVVPAQNVAVIPTLVPPLGWAEAAAFSLVTLTAWRMLVTRAQVRAGETVLIWGIGGAGARRPGRLLRRDDGSQGRHRPAAPVLVSVVDPGLDHGERRRVPGDRAPARHGRAAAPRGPRVSVRRGAGGVRAAGAGGAVGANRDSGG